MAYTVGEVARLTRVSVRALHHYDEIGLVKPRGRSAAGYRLYTDEDLERLQQVLFYRELGMRLDDIAGLLGDPAFDRRKALEAHREALRRRLDETRGLLALVEKTIRSMDGGVAMTKEEMFEAFGDFDAEAHEAEARERWGDTEAFRESQRRAKRYTKEDWKRMGAEAEAIVEEFARAAESGVAAADAANIAERHRLHIERWFYPCTRPMHAGLGKMYVDDPRFAAHYEKRREGLAAYVRDAVLANALR